MLRTALSRVATLEQMKLPGAPEPVRAYLAVRIRFTFDLQQRRFYHVRTGEVGTLQSVEAPATVEQVV